MLKSSKILLTGGAGFVGRNLIEELLFQGYTHITVLDKNHGNVETLRQACPQLAIHHVDLADTGDWEIFFNNIDVLILLHAQVCALKESDYIRNTNRSTGNVLNAARRAGIPYLVHISSSVVHSVANDGYTRSKREQERQVAESGLPALILRPTLMFGAHDHKHFGWLARFMKRIPLFPVPGHGRYLRQPLYVRDFCRVIISGITTPMPGKSLNITGLEMIDYIDCIRRIKTLIRARCIILRIPYRMFYALLAAYSWLSKAPPFTTEHLKAIAAGDQFDVIDWPAIFGVQATSLQVAINETFHP